MKRPFFFFLFLSLTQISLSGQLEERYTYTTQAMGTSWHLIFYCADQEKADDIAQRCWSRLDSLNMILSDYEAHSELSRLSASSGSDRWVPVSAPLWEILSFSDELAQRSDGAFDITIGPLSKIWRRAIRRKEFPEDHHLATAKSKVGYEHIAFDQKTQSVRLGKKEMQLDLGGVAKGYAIRELYDMIVASGVHSVLVDGGGDMMIGDLRLDGSSWDVQIEGSSKKFSLRQEAIACSGPSYRSIDFLGQTYSHIVDPQSGLGVQSPSTHCVIAKDPMVADALASTMSVLDDIDQDILAYYKARLILVDQSSMD